MPHVTLAGDLHGEYVVDERLPDGRLVMRPDTSAAAMNRRMGVEPLSVDEFDAFVREHGPHMLPLDGEG